MSPTTTGGNPISPFISTVELDGKAVDWMEKVSRANGRYRGTVTLTRGRTEARHASGCLSARTSSNGCCSVELGQNRGGQNVGSSGQRKARGCARSAG